MLTDILKGFLIGLCASVPMGPVAIFVIQKSLGKGRMAGFFTGLGATLVDTIYAILSIFALTVAQEFIDNHTNLILIGGGLVCTAVGYSMVFNDPFRKLTQEQGYLHSLKDFFKSVAMSLSNPGAIFAMFALFAFFDVQVSDKDFTIAPIILAVSSGSIAYWFVFSWLFSKIRKNFKLITLLWINRISGAIVMLIGIALFADGLMKLIFK